MVFNQISNYVMKIIRLSIFILFLLTFTWSCQDDTQTPQLNESLTVEKARMWFENSISNTNISNIFRVKSSDSTVFDLTPLFNWDLAELDNDSIWSVVELPWEYHNGYVSIKSSEVMSNSSANDVNTNQVLKLVILKNRITNKIYGFKMVIVPDLLYISTYGDKINTNTYFDRDSKLSGSVLFYSLDDKFTNGWVYQKGKIVAKVYKLKQNASNVKPGLSKASMEMLITAIETCYYGYNMMGTYTSDPYLIRCSTSYFFSYADEVACNDGFGGGFEEPNGGGGGGGGDTSPNSTAQAITVNINLNNEGIILFNEALEQLLVKCGYNTMYNYLTQNGGHFNGVSINPNSSDPANYNSHTGNLTFQSNSTISTIYLQEEFVHLFQNSIYPGGIEQYSNNGHSNIEFEAKLIEDIICTIYNPGCAYYGSTFSNNADYINWLYIITNDGTTFPNFNALLTQHQECGSKNYWDFLNDFATNPDKPNYNYPVNSILIPLGINYININPCEKN